jgi:hypothetical protein
VLTVRQGTCNKQIHVLVNDLVLLKRTDITCSRWQSPASGWMSCLVGMRSEDGGPKFLRNKDHHCPGYVVPGTQCTAILLLHLMFVLPQWFLLTEPPDMSVQRWVRAFSPVHFSAQ